MPQSSSTSNIQLYTVNGGKPSASVPLRRYEAMRTAVLQALKAAGSSGLTLHELAVAVAPLLPQWWSDEGWDEMWHVTSVKLHLEYLGELERVPDAKPHRLRLTGSNVGGPARDPAASPAARPTKSRGGPKSPKEMGEAILNNLPQRTGRSLAEWVQLVRAEGCTELQEAKRWLKQTHGLTTLYAYAVASAALQPPGMIDYGDEAGLLNAMYSGARAGLRPVYDTLDKLILALGPEVERVVCKTYTNYRAPAQFAVLKPTTQTGIDLGLALPPDTPYTARLLEAKNLGGGERNRHRLRLGSVKEIDAEVKRWLRAAYQWEKSRKSA